MRITKAVIGMLLAMLLGGVDAMGVPALPAINTNNVLNILSFGAVSSSTLTNTTAIQNAINAAAAGGATNGLSGGTVEIPAGTYLSGPLTMKSKVNLQVDSGATLMMLPKTGWPNTSTQFIYGAGLSDIEISGAGAINGQGAGWWGSSPRPNFIQFDKTVRILIQDVTLQNPPTFHLYLKNGDGNVTIQGINIDTVPTSPNTDGMDVGSTNMLIQNCHISDGDDNIELGGSSYTSANITITNCLFGNGHGISVGSDTGAGVSNVTVINCVFTNTDNAIRMKSDNDRGGVVQNMAYYNIGMTNIRYAPILIYSYYNAYGNPSASGITPAVAAGTAIATASPSTPVWRNIVISNVTATAAQPGMIWARTELPATNIILEKLNITATDSGAGNGSFALYNVSGVQVIDSQIKVAGSRKTFELFDAGVIFSNTATGANAISLDGLSVTNALGFYNQSASLSDGTFFGANAISLGASTISDAASLALGGATPINFTLGTNNTQIAVTGNLNLSSTINISAGAGFGAATYTLFTYTGGLTGTPLLATTPAGFNYSLNTSTTGQITLLVTSSGPPAPANLTALGTNLQIILNWNAVSGASSYNLYRGTSNGGPYPTEIVGLATTNYLDNAVTNGTTYFYVVTAVVSGIESANSLPANAAPLPSNQPTPITAQVVSGSMQIFWPHDHLGWSLEIQTNALNAGLRANWFVVPGSTVTNQLLLPINPANPSVFLRLVSP
jgi:polygalacturonase